jgi:hypothetical protein
MIHPCTELCIYTETGRGVARSLARPPPPSRRSSRRRLPPAVFRARRACCTGQREPLSEQAVHPWIPLVTHISQSKTDISQHKPGVHVCSRRGLCTWGRAEQTRRPRARVGRTWSVSVRSHPCEVRRAPLGCHCNSGVNRQFRTGSEASPWPGRFPFPPL